MHQYFQRQWDASSSDALGACFTRQHTPGMWFSTLKSPENYPHGKVEHAQNTQTRIYCNKAAERPRSLPEETTQQTCPSWKEDRQRLSASTPAAFGELGNDAHEESAVPQGGQRTRETAAAAAQSRRSRDKQGEEKGEHQEEKTGKVEVVTSLGRVRLCM